MDTLSFPAHPCRSEYIPCHSQHVPLSFRAHPSVIPSTSPCHSERSEESQRTANDAAFRFLFSVAVRS